MAASYEDSVFVNVPFDKRYSQLSDAIVFAVHDCGFVARSALEVDDSGQARVDKILDIIAQSKFGVHDISRAGIDRKTRLARFNMPLELGFFLGAKRYGSPRDRQKRCLVLDRDRYRYRNFCSDIAGQDIRAHNDRPRDAITAVAIGSVRTEPRFRCRAARLSTNGTSGSARSCEFKHCTCTWTLPS